MCVILLQMDQRIIVLFIHLHSKELISYTQGGFIHDIAGSNTIHSHPFVKTVRDATA